MSQRLKSKDKQIPNGFYFRQVEINWDSRKVIGLHPSFSTLVSAVMGARKANPSHAAKHKWATDKAGVENDVELFQVKVCLANGWMNYITSVGGGADPVPLSQQASPQESARLAAAGAVARKIWAGVKTSNDWMDAGDIVPKTQAESRAAVCVECPMNSKEGEGKGLLERLTGLFTDQAAKAIKRQIERKNEMNLSTPLDGRLFVCTGCLCPLPTKIWSPIKYIKTYTAPDVFADLRDNGKNCWVVKEMEAV